MENEPRAKTLGDYTGLLRRRWRYPVSIIPLTMLITVFIAYALPVSYRSAGTIMLESSSIPASLVPSTVTGSTVIEEYAGQQLELARRRVMSKESLLDIVKQIDPYPDLKVDAAEKASMIGDSTSVAGVDPITLEPTIHATAFSIYYQNPDPKLSAEVGKKLVNLFVTYNQRTRAELAAQAYTFLQQQAQQLEASMRGMEARLAALKLKYGDALPDAEGRNLAGADRAQRDVDTVERSLLASEQQRDLLQLQLNDIPPSLTTAVVGDWRTELAKARAELALDEQKYTPEHPDVKRMRRVVADLVAQGGGPAGAAGIRPDNPDYLRVQAQLTGVDRELQSLRSTAARAREKLSSFERNLASTPNITPEYVQLSREYENAQGSYKDLQSKMKNAALSQTLEAEARGEKFSLVKSPSVPKTPFSPNRIGIILLGFVISTALAIALAVIADASDPTVRSVSDLTDIMEAMPVGAIPVMFNRDDRRHIKLVWGSLTAGFVAAAVIVAATVVSNH